MNNFLHVDDLADACHFLLNSYDNEDVINIFRAGSVSEIFKLNIHNFIWKQLKKLNSIKLLKSF